MSETYSAAVRESSDFWEKLWLRDGALGWLLVASLKLELGRGGGSMMLGVDGKCDLMSEESCVWVGLMIEMEGPAASRFLQKGTLRVG